MKYEFKAVGRLLLPLYGAWLALSIILGISINMPSLFGRVLLTGSTMLYGFCCAAAVAATAFILIQRFYKNLLGNEGYFMFALPVTTGRHLLNKTISAVIWIAIGCIVAMLTGLAISIGSGGLEIFQEFGHFWKRLLLPSLSDGKSILLIAESILIAIVFCGEAVAKIYAAIAVGHQWGNHRVVGAIGAYIGFAVAEMAAASILESLADRIGLFSMFDKAFPLLASGYANLQISMLEMFLVGCLLLAIYWFITWKLLDKRLNLE